MADILFDKRRKVDVLICDEASQAIEAETLLALSLRPAKIILVGDPKQLSATLHSKDAISKHFDRSLMCRLMEGVILLTICWIPNIECIQKFQRGHLNNTTMVCYEMPMKSAKKD